MKRTFAALAVLLGAAAAAPADDPQPRIVAVSVLLNAHPPPLCHPLRRRGTQPMKDSFAAQTHGEWVARSSRAMTHLKWRAAESPFRLRK